MPFIAENELERTLYRAVREPATAPDFYRLLLASELLVLGTVEGQENADDKFTLAPGGKLNLIPGVKNDGSKFLPVFSSLPRMQEYLAQESKFLRINARALLELTRGAPIFLNPASEFGKELTAHEVQQLLDGKPAVSEPRMVVGEAEFPMALVNALTGVFEARPDIAAAWMIQVTFADRAHEPHPLVGIEPLLPNIDWPSLMQQIEAAASEAVPGMVFDIQRIDRRNPVSLTQALLSVPPFYQATGPLN